MKKQRHIKKEMGSLFENFRQKHIQRNNDKSYDAMIEVVRMFRDFLEEVEVALIRAAKRSKMNH